MQHTYGSSLYASNAIQTYYCRICLEVGRNLEEMWLLFTVVRKLPCSIVPSMKDCCAPSGVVLSCSSLAWSSRLGGLLTTFRACHFQAYGALVVLFRSRALLAYGGGLLSTVAQKEMS